MSDESLQTAHRLYDAFAARDATALFAVLAPDFRGVVAEGMPNGLGGIYDGAETMLNGCWARVFATFDVRPVPDEFLPVGPDRIVVMGRYIGMGRGSGQPLSAAFAHVLRISRDDRVSELVQITDTGCWRDALGGS